MIKKIKNKNMKWWLKIMSCTTLFAIIFVFAFMKMSFIIKGVQIVAEMNKNGDSSLVEIKGNAKNATHITLNGREIFINKDGAFSESVALLPGFSIIGLTAKDKFGKTQEKKFEVVYEESAPSVALGGKVINTN